MKPSADLLPYVGSAKVTAASDKTTATGRTASVTLEISESADEYVTRFKAAARVQGYEERVDRKQPTGRVIAFATSGDRTLTLQLTTEKSGTLAALVLLVP